MSTQASANLNIMIKAARQAARGLLRDFGEVENLQVSSKGPGDFVSRADTKAEETIREPTDRGAAELRLARRGKHRESRARTPTRRWIVDPLDGTTNFLHGLPHWAMSIALEHKGEIVAAVVYDPAKDEMFTAEKGAGAYLNDRRLRVSGRRDLIETVLRHRHPLRRPPRRCPAPCARWPRLVPRTAGIRRWGAAALDLAYVAAGGSTASGSTG